MKSEPKLIVLDPLGDTELVKHHMSKLGKNAAYRDWLLNLNHRDQLPRGRFFKGKIGGKPKPKLYIDEAHFFNRKTISAFDKAMIMSTIIRN